MKTLIAIFALCLSAFASHTCTTCYIDCVNGSDANSGATKILAWKHLHEMAGATGNASTQVVAPGDSYILIGNETWPNSTLGFAMIVNGSVGNPIYYGVDQTWFANVAGTANTDATGKIVTWVTGVHTLGDFSSSW